MTNFLLLLLFFFKGHTFAGGMLFALTCEGRVASSDKVCSQRILEESKRLEK